jgi:type IV secretory pathway VirB3-like protein
MPGGCIVIPENRALARRPLILGLPSGYAALLIMTSLFLALSLDRYGAAIFLFAALWSLGKALTLHDPFAWTLLWRALTVPGRLRS